MTNLPFKENSCDAIICIAVFHHLKTNEERIKSLKEMARVLKKNGTVLLSVWSFHQPQKTKRVFEKYGDIIVPWNKRGNIYHRYYDIVEKGEFEKLANVSGFGIKHESYECGNEVYYLEKK